MSTPVPKAEILVVDDDWATRVLLSGLLRQQGYQVAAASCGAEALTAAHARQPALILLDVMLPDTDGFALCRELQCVDATSRAPIIFLTAKGDEHEVVRGLRAGGVDYIVKPFAAEVLLARVDTHVTLSQLSRGLYRALDEHAERLQQANRRLRALNMEMATVEERQRRQLAQQVHDTTIQELVLARILVEGGPATSERRDQLTGLLATAIEQLRSLVFELSPPMLQRRGLFDALEWLAAEMGQQWGLDVVCERSGAPPVLAEVQALVLFQGARELLINAAKHAEATRAVLTLSHDGDRLTIVVSDDGRGFEPGWLADPDAAPAADDGETARGGFGLYSLRSRMELLGGCLRLSNRRDRGAEAMLSIRAHAAVPDSDV